MSEHTVPNRKSYRGSYIPDKTQLPKVPNRKWKPKNNISNDEVSLPKIPTNNQGHLPDRDLPSSNGNIKIKLPKVENKASPLPKNQSNMKKRTKKDSSKKSIIRQTPPVKKWIPKKISLQDLPPEILSIISEYSVNPKISAVSHTFNQIALREMNKARENPKFYIELGHPFVKYLMNDIKYEDEIFKVLCEQNKKDLLESFSVKFLKNNANKGLKCAAGKGHKNLVDFFISLGSIEFNHGLVAAAENGDVELVKFFIQKGTKELDPAMKLAIKTWNEELFDYLLDNGYDNWDFVLRNAVLYDNDKLIDIAIEKGASDWDGVLQGAIIGNKKKIGYFLEKGASDFDLAMSTAASSGDMNLVDDFINKGGRVLDEFFILHDIDMLIHLLENEIIVNYDRIMYHAGYYGYNDIIEYCIKNGEPVDIYSIVEGGLAAGKKEILELIAPLSRLESGDFDNFSAALACSAESNNIELVEYLLGLNKWSISSVAKAAIRAVYVGNKFITNMLLERLDLFEREPGFLGGKSYIYHQLLIEAASNGNKDLFDMFFSLLDYDTESLNIAFCYAISNISPHGGYDTVPEDLIDMLPKFSGVNRGGNLDIFKFLMENYSHILNKPIDINNTWGATIPFARRIFYPSYSKLSLFQHLISDPSTENQKDGILLLKDFVAQKFPDLYVTLIYLNMPLPSQENLPEFQLRNFGDQTIQIQPQDIYNYNYEYGDLDDEDYDDIE